MARAHVLIALVATLATLCHVSNVLAEEPSVRLTFSGSGTLAAAQLDNKSWTVLQAGDPVPPRCRLRSAAGDASEVQLPGGTLVIAGGSELELDAPRRQVVLTAGRVLLQTGDQAGACDVGGGHVSVAANSKIEFAASTDFSSAAVVSGSATAARADWPALDLREQQTVGWKASDKTWSSKPLSESELSAITAWSTARAPQGLGQLLITDTQAGSTTRLNIARYHVNVVLEPPVALVQIDQSFYNPLPRQEEGTFVFNLPSGASVSRFAMYVSPTSLIEGELIERQQAASIYQSIVNQRRDPAILEQIGDNLFKMRVFPVPPSDSKRILLDFTLPLETRDGQYVFRLPLLSDLKPIWDFRITGSLRGPTVPGSVHVDPPYDLHPAPRGDAIGLDLSQKMFQPQHDLTIRFRQKIEGAPVVRSFAEDDRRFYAWLNTSGQRTPVLPNAINVIPAERQPCYFWAALPPDAQAGHADASPADVLVLVDSSGSGQDRRQLSDSLAGTLLASLRPTDRFRLACVDITARSLCEWQAAEPAGVASALASFDKELFLGGVDLAASLSQALSLKEASTRRTMMVYLGDALDRVSQQTGKELSDVLCQQLRGAEIPFFAATSRSAGQGRPLLNEMAGASGGLVFDLGLAEGRQNFFGWLLAGLPLPTQIQSLQVSGVAAEDLFHPTAWPVGQILPIIGRCELDKPLEISIVLGHKGAERPIKIALPRPAKQDDVFVGRCWAQRKLDALRAQENSVTGTSDPQRMRIAALSQEWSLLSPYTAFLVLESEEDYTRWKIDRQQRHRYWRPPAANVEQPLPESWVRLVTPDRAALARDQLTAGLSQARTALQEHQPAVVRRHLQRIAGLPGAVLSPEYKALVKQLQEYEAHRAQSAAFQARRESLDASQRAEEESQSSPQLARLLVGEVSSEFLRRFPLAGRLLQDARARRAAAPFKPDDPAEPATLQDLIRQFEAATGVHVLLDKKALEDAGTGADIPARPRLHGTAPISWRSYWRMVLGPMDLAMIEKGQRITITTREKADATLSLDVYPVADLLLADRLPDRNLLSNPYLDLRLANEERIKSSLKQTVLVNFLETPVDEVADYFSAKLGVNVLLDAKALEDAGTGTDSPVTGQVRNETAAEALRWLLSPKDLAYVIRDEALVITTKVKADAALRVRLHHGAGVVYESSRPASGRKFNGMGGIGGGMGGMGGGSFGGAGGGGGGAVFGGGGGFGMGGGFGGGMGGGFGGGVGMGGGGGVTFGGSAGGMGGMGGMMGGGQNGPAGQPVAGLQDDTPAGQVASSNTAPTAGAPTSSEKVAALDIGATPAATAPPAVAIPQASGAARPPMVTAYDSDSMTDMITTTIAPTTWDEVGGPGSLAFFTPTLDYVLATTDDVHDQIDDLFDRLRKIPIIAGPAGSRAAQRGRPVTIEEGPMALEMLHSH